MCHLLERRPIISCGFVGGGHWLASVANRVLTRWALVLTRQGFFDVTSSKEENNCAECIPALFPSYIQVIGVADPRACARKELQEAHHIDEDNVFDGKLSHPVCRAGILR